MSTLAVVQAAPHESYVVDAVMMFTLFFIVLGPLKMLVPFERRTRSLGRGELRALSLRAVLIGAVGVIGGGFTGSAMLAAWNIAPPILLFSLGLIFFAVAFRLVMQQYDAPAAAPAEPPAGPPPVLQIVFPLIAPPYGVAAVIVLLALSETRERTFLICALVLAVMLLNLLAMVYVRHLMRGLPQAVLQVFGAVLGVLQVALAVRIVFEALRDLGVLALPGLER